MITFQKIPAVAATLILATVFSFFDGPVSRAQGTDSAGIENQEAFVFSTDSDFVLLRFSVYHPMIDAADNARTCIVYGNGMVRVHVPQYMKNAGDYSMMLSLSELNGLLSKLAKNGLFEIDGGFLAIQ